MSKKVFISAGHGGSDSGAVGNGFKEKDLNLSIALACGDYLKSRGVEVQMSRVKDENDDLNQEARESNAFGPDLAVSIHNNAGGGDGVEAWYSIFGGLGRLVLKTFWPKLLKSDRIVVELKQRRVPVEKIITDLFARPKLRRSSSNAHL